MTDTKAVPLEQLVQQELDAALVDQKLVETRVSQLREELAVLETIAIRYRGTGNTPANPLSWSQVDAVAWALGQVEQPANVTAVRQYLADHGRQMSRTQVAGCLRGLTTSRYEGQQRAVRVRRGLYRVASRKG